MGAARLAALALVGTLSTGLIPATALASPPPTEVHHPAWAQRANIYEVNIRQYTPEGTFAAFERQLPRLKAMGVDILWIMPINPISAKARKGKLGSYYAVRNYKAINPEFGDLDSFKHLVRMAHALGMKVIVDWVANHTGADNDWLDQHPDWYLHDDQGRIGPYTYVENGHREVWEDVVGLDYSKPALWDGMIDAMSYWVREADIDGFRCDVAGKVPTAFWEAARKRLDTIKPVFMLAESDKPELEARAFDMVYDWELYHLLVRIAHGQAGKPELVKLITEQPARFPAGGYQMTFTSDHDENSWAGSDKELYGAAFPAMAVLAATLPGMPLVYSGQEAGLNKRLAFFERDPIDWDRYARADLYRRLLKLKHDHPALANGAAGAPLQVLDTADDKLFAFRRASGADKVTVVVNLSPEPRKLALSGFKHEMLEPWGYRIAE